MEGAGQGWRTPEATHSPKAAAGQGTEGKALLSPAIVLSVRMQGGPLHGLCWGSTQHPGHVVWVDSCFFWPQVTWWVSTREARPCQRVCFLFGGAGICSSCVNPEVVASPVRKHSCDFLACDPVLGPQPLRSSHPREDLGLPRLLDAPAGVTGACGFPRPKARLAMGLPGPPPAPSQRRLHWGLRTSSRAGFLSTPAELGAPFGQCGQGEAGPTSFPSCRRQPHFQLRKARIQPVEAIPDVFGTRKSLP